MRKRSHSLTGRRRGEGMRRRVFFLSRTTRFLHSVSSGSGRWKGGEGSSSRSSIACVVEESPAAREQQGSAIASGRGRERAEDRGGEGEKEGRRGGGEGGGGDGGHLPSAVASASPSLSSSSSQSSHSPPRSGTPLSLTSSPSPLPSSSLHHVMAHSLLLIFLSNPRHGMSHNSKYTSKHDECCCLPQSPLPPLTCLFPERQGEEAPLTHSPLPPSPELRSPSPSLSPSPSTLHDPFRESLSRRSRRRPALYCRVIAAE